MGSAKRPPELQAIFDEIERAGPFASLEEINRLLAVRMREYNASQQAALGGLSPDEMTWIARESTLTSVSTTREWIRTRIVLLVV